MRDGPVQESLASGYACCEDEQRHGEGVKGASADSEVTGKRRMAPAEVCEAQENTILDSKGPE
jgi:hypothetical protein